MRVEFSCLGPALQRSFFVNSDQVRSDAFIKETNDGGRELVIAVAGDHVRCACDVDDGDVTDTRHEFIDALLGDDVAHAPSHEERGNEYVVARHFQ